VTISRRVDVLLRLRFPILRQNSKLLQLLEPPSDVIVAEASTRTLSLEPVKSLPEF
jgi:hypothetical protein